MDDKSGEVPKEFILDTALSTALSTSCIEARATTTPTTTSYTTTIATSASVTVAPRLFTDSLLDSHNYSSQPPLIHLSRNFLSAIPQTLNHDSNAATTLLSTMHEEQGHPVIQESLMVAPQPIVGSSINNRTMHIVDLSKIPQIEPMTPPIGIAPPSYSVVMSQPARIAPIPTFLPRFPPPPNYNTTYGLYTEYLGSILPTTQSGRFLSPRPLPIVCPSCGTLGVTVTRTHHSAITHLSALGLFLCFCWPCCILPYFMDTCKDSFHYCPNCEQYLGSYTPW